MSEALVKRLRSELCNEHTYDPDKDAAADRIEALEREVKELRADIETFWKPQFDEQVERAEAAEADKARLTRERDKERKHVARLMRDLDHNRNRAEKAEAQIRAALGEKDD